MGNPIMIMPTRAAALHPQPEKLITRIMNEDRMKAQDATLVEALTALLSKDKQLIAEEMLALRSKISELQDENRKQAQYIGVMLAKVRATKGRLKRTLLKWAAYKARKEGTGFRHIRSHK